MRDFQVHHYGGPFYSTQTSSTALTKQQQQQQQRLWAAHYRPDDSPKTPIQFLNWQNGATPQQQQLMSITASPFSSGKMTRQDYHIPSAYEEHGGGFRTNALPLQLLCNERL